MRSRRFVLRIVAFVFAGALARGLQADDVPKSSPPAADAAKAPLPSPPDEISPPKLLDCWGQKGTADGQFETAVGIAINAANDVFVTDARRGCLQRFTREGKFLDKVDTGAFSGGVALDRDGLIYVSVMMEYKISVYRHTPPAADAPDRRAYELVREWGKKGTGDGEFDQPGGIAFGPDGSLYVCDQVNHRMQRFTPEGKFLAKWGEYGDADGQFGKPEAVYSRVGGPCFAAFDCDGSLYTTEPRPGRIQKFSAEGKWLASWGSNEVRNGAFGGGKGLVGPIGIMFDRENRAWISATNHRVQAFTPAGRYLTGLGTTATPSDEQGQFRTPHGMAFDSQGVLYVVDSLNHRIERFAFDGR